MIGVEKIAKALGGATRSGDGWQARCPAHDDHTPSLSITQRNGKLLVHCHRGCDQKAVISKLKAKGLWPEAGHSSGRGGAVAVYEYRDEAGKVRYQVLRYPTKPDGGKDFRQRRPDGNGGWTWNMKGVDPLPYRLPELLAADPGSIIYIAEGEKDCDNLAALGEIATCNHMGASKWRPEISHWLQGRNVVILPDNDDTGRKHAEDVARKLCGVAKSIRVLPLPGLKEKGDVSDWIVAGGTKKELSEFADAAPEWAAPPTGSAAEETYEAREDGIYWNVNTDGVPVSRRLSDFAARIVEVTLRDDGSDRVARELLVESGADRAVVPADEFDAMDWVTENWVPYKRILVGREFKQRLADAIKTLSHDAPTRTVYAHLGWRKIGGRWLYLHAGGAIGADGPVEGFEVDPGGELAHYRLPPVRDLRAAVRASLGMLDLGARIGPLMLAAVYRAPLNEFCETACSFFLVGATGVFKSAVEGVAQAHWGSRWDGRRFPANWSSTANALERLAFAAKDCVLGVDDFAPGGAERDVRQLHAIADRLLRGAGNRGGRSRMGADGSLRPVFYPRALVMASGEDLPKGQSLRARMVSEHVGREDVDLEVLGALQRHAAEEVLAEAMAGYARWLARQADGLKRALAERSIKLRAEVSAEHPRTPDNYASLMLGAEHALAFARDSGAISEDEEVGHRGRIRGALLGSAEAQGAAQASQNPARRFVELVREVLAGGRGHLATREGGAPIVELRDACGWRQVNDGWHPQCDRLGWIEGDDVWLRPALAYSAVERLCREQGATLGITEATLGKRLADKGLIEHRSGDQQYTKRVRVKDETMSEDRFHAYQMSAAVVLGTAGKRTYAERVEALRGAARAIQEHAKEGRARAVVDQMLRDIDDVLSPAAAREEVPL